jgi:hypothetical protein
VSGRASRVAEVARSEARECERTLRGTAGRVGGSVVLAGRVHACRGYAGIVVPALVTNAGCTSTGLLVSS